MDTYIDASYASSLDGKPYMMPVSPWFYTNMPTWTKNWLWRGDVLWFDRWRQVQYVQPEWVCLLAARRRSTTRRICHTMAGDDCCRTWSICMLRTASRLKRNISFSGIASNLLTPVEPDRQRGTQRPSCRLSFHRTKLSRIGSFILLFSIPPRRFRFASEACTRRQAGQTHLTVVSVSITAAFLLAEILEKWR